jgi:hypothetical protein
LATAHATPNNPYVRLIKEIQLLAEEAPGEIPLPDLSFDSEKKAADAAPKAEEEEDGISLPSFSISDFMLTKKKKEKPEPSSEIESPTPSAEAAEQKTKSKKVAKKKKKKKRKKKKISPPKKVELEGDEDIVASEEGDNITDENKEPKAIADVELTPFPRIRPRLNYKTERLPKLIYNKQYSPENGHLPVAQYDFEYKQLLFGSIANYRTDLLRTLASYFKGTEIRDPEGNTPLIYATTLENHQAALTLIGMGADVNAVNFLGVNSLTIALKNKDHRLMKMLLNAGADPDRRTTVGYTSLHNAAIVSDNVAIELLLEHNANPNIKTKKGNTPLHIATINGNEYGSYQLINYGSDIESRNFKGETPLMLAAIKNQTRVASLLLNAGAQVNKKSAKGLSAVHMALQHKSYNVAQLIETEITKRKLSIENIVKEHKRSTKAPVSRQVLQTASSLPDIQAPLSLTPKQHVRSVVAPMFTAKEKKKMNMPEPMFTKKEKYKIDGPKPMFTKKEQHKINSPKPMFTKKEEQLLNQPTPSSSAN